MGYTTNFEGMFHFDRQLDPQFHMELVKFSEARHGDNINTEIGMPGLYCQWTPNKEGLGLIWNGMEKFYNYIEWLKWLIDNELEPNGYVLNGRVFWYGDDTGDIGTIEVKDSHIFVTKGQVIQDGTKTVEI